MPSLTFPKGETAILVMDCQNDIVDEKGKMAAMNNGAMARLIKDHNVLGAIARAWPRLGARWECQLSTCAMPIAPITPTRRTTRQSWRG